MPIVFSISMPKATVAAEWKWASSQDYLRLYIERILLMSARITVIYYHKISRCISARSQGEIKEKIRLIGNVNMFVMSANAQSVAHIVVTARAAALPPVHNIDLVSYLIGPANELCNLEIIVTGFEKRDNIPHFQMCALQRHVST